MGDVAAKSDVPPSSSSASKVEDNGLDHSSTSTSSTPEAEQEHERGPDAGAGVDGQGPPPPQKRKGGRKPIYATSEERKQRNRQAQAAFRERRTEYIKQLEQTIKLHEEHLQTLQSSHRSAADECLMLRYKNSLLERILLEKGIDVQAELQARDGSPTLGPTRGHAPTPATQPISRYPIPKYSQNRRSLPAKPDAVGRGGPLLPAQSPRAGPTAASHLSSPALSATRSPNFLPQGGTVSPSFGPVAQPGQQLRPQQPPLRPQFHPPQRPSLVTTYPVSSAASSASTAGSAASASSASGGPNYYPSPFQAHYDQLDQEYDAQADMIEDQEPSETSPGAYPPHYHPSINRHPASAQMHTQGGTQHIQPHTAPAQGQDGAAGQHLTGFDPYDPMLDADPFGLSASMHFPTQFSFENGR